MGGLREHWDGIYRGRADRDLTWYQPRPERSLALVRAAGHGPAGPIIDVGGGASTLVDALLGEGYRDVAVLDVSEAGLARAKARLGPRAARVSWIVADVTAWRPERTWSVWHDRAVFHFLTDRAAQDAYIDALETATVPGSVAVIATFALDGPERCSGLAVQRYSPATLAARIGPGFALFAEAAEDHVTPAGRTQGFAYAAFRRR